MERSHFSVGVVHCDRVLVGVADGGVARWRDHFN